MEAFSSKRGVWVYTVSRMRMYVITGKVEETVQICFEQHAALTQTGRPKRSKKRAARDGQRIARVIAHLGKGRLEVGRQ